MQLGHSDAVKRIMSIYGVVSALYWLSCHVLTVKADYVDIPCCVCTVLAVMSCSNCKADYVDIPCCVGTVLAVMSCHVMF